MNVKLAWEIGWKLGMAKRAAGGLYGRLMTPVRKPMQKTLGAISKANAGPSGGAGAAPDSKGVLSIGSADGDSAANSSGAAPDPNGVLKLDPSTRKYLGGGGGQQGQENNFWSSVPSPANSQQTTADMYNRFLGFNSPAEYSGWRDAQTSGLGRALKARSDNQFVRMMLDNM